MHVTVLGWLEPCARSLRGHTTPCTWTHPAQSTCATTLGRSSLHGLGQGWPQRVAGPTPCCPASRCRHWCRHGRVALLSPRRTADQPRAATLPLPSHHRRVRACPLYPCAAASPVQGRHCHAHVAELAVALSFKTLRPCGPHRSEACMHVC